MNFWKSSIFLFCFLLSPLGFALKKTKGEKLTYELIEKARKELLGSTREGDQSLKDEVYIYQPEKTLPQKSLVVLGGMGPEAGLLAWEKAIRKFPERRIILDQRCSIPDRNTAILKGMQSKKAKKVAAKLAESFALASTFGSEKNRADVFVSCNTAHAFIAPALKHLSPKQKKKLHIHSIIESAVQAAHSIGKETLVLGTTGTEKLGLYNKAIKKHHVHKLSLSKKDQGSLMKAIYGVKKGDPLATTKYGLDALSSSLKEGKVEAIIAGCTEIPILLDKLKKSGKLQFKKLKIIDPVEEVLRSLI